MEPMHDSLDLPKWYYQGGDQLVYGPYSSNEMDKWYKTGYFNEAMLMRTKNEERFHTLAEWTHYSSGQNPFMLLVNSFDHLISLGLQMQMSQMMLAPRLQSPNGSYVMVPPHSASRTVTPLPLGAYPTRGFVPYQQNPLIIAPPAIPYSIQQAFSQPPSEPAVDDMQSTISNTPEDSEVGWNATNVPQNEAEQMFCHVGVDTSDAPWVVTCEQGTTARTELVDAMTQTGPCKVSAENAAILLAELTGINFEVTSS